jgi:hypothetical protein
MLLIRVRTSGKISKQGNHINPIALKTNHIEIGKPRTMSIGGRVLGQMLSPLQNRNGDNCLILPFSFSPSKSIRG